MPPLVDPEARKEYKRRQKSHQAEMTDRNRERYQSDPAVRAASKRPTTRSTGRNGSPRQKFVTSKTGAPKRLQPRNIGKKTGRRFGCTSKICLPKKGRNGLARAPAIKAWKIKNKDRLNSSLSIRLRTDFNFRIKGLLRGRIRMAVAGKREGGRHDVASWNRNRRIENPSRVAVHGGYDSTLVYERRNPY